MELDHQKDLVRLASVADPFQAHIWEQILHHAGIRCEVLGDYLDAGLIAMPDVSAEVWVEAADIQRAEAILRRHRLSPRNGDPVL